MQQIERYGVIALVFLLVTIVAVSFWGDSKSPGFWSRLTGRGVKKEAATAQTAEAPTTSEPTSERAIARELPMNPVAPTPQTPVTPIDPAPQASAQQPKVAAVPPPTPQLAPDPTPTRIVPQEPTRTSHPVTPTQSPAASEYVVQKGDSMMQIATRMLGSRNRWTEIRDMNPRVDPGRLKVGTKLAMPVSASAARSANPANAPVHKSAVAPASKEHATTKGASSGTYLVRKGDTMKSIAERQLGDAARWKEIAEANPHLDAHHLSVGTSLHLPGGKSEPLVAAAMPSDLSSRPHVR